MSNTIGRVALGLAGLACSAAFLFGGGALSAQGSQQSVWDGVFTEEQAARGAVAYSQDCSVCHGATLDGTGEAPSITGAQFQSTWNGLTVGDMFERVRTTMPFDRPNGLSRAVYADIVAFMLKFNGYPAGSRPLNSRAEMLNMIGISSQRPAGVGGGTAQPSTPSSENIAVGDPNSYPNPYRTETTFFKLPSGRTMGSTSAVATDSKGNIWVAERCGANSCSDSKIDPIMMFDSGGRFIRAFGGGMFNFPHGFFIDAQDNVWLTDARVEGGKGGTVTKFSPSGKVLLVLGKRGVATAGTDGFVEPNAVLVVPDGSIFVADGHTPDKTSRVMKFDERGIFIKQWGEVGSGQGQLNVPHTLSIDSSGRIYVGDRANDRVQIYDQEGILLGSWTQFGRPSGLFVDHNDVLYSTDSESRTPAGYGYHPGWKRGIRIGSVRDGRVTAFIPDPEPNPDLGATSGAEGIWVDRNGVIYGAQVKEKLVARHVK